MSRDTQRVSATSVRSFGIGSRVNVSSRTPAVHIVTPNFGLPFTTLEVAYGENYQGSHKTKPGGILAIKGGQ